MNKVICIEYGIVTSISLVMTIIGNCYALPLKMHQCHFFLILLRCTWYSTKLLTYIDSDTSIDSLILYFNIVTYSVFMTLINIHCTNIHKLLLVQFHLYVFYRKRHLLHWIQWTALTVLWMRLIMATGILCYKQSNHLSYLTKLWLNFMNRWIVSMTIMFCYACMLLSCVMHIWIVLNLATKLLLDTSVNQWRCITLFNNMRSLSLEFYSYSQ